ncbi:MAG: Spx/MgsR family RNA polymerase-binding regulatory protein [Pseudomonadota bacterium]
MATSITLYGLTNCDSCRKARRWLKGHDHEFADRDVRSDGLATSDLSRWVSAVGWETLVNRKSRTWRELADAERAALNESTVVHFLIAHPTLLKRPVVEDTATGTVIVGFNPDAYSAL